ncbi:MAG: hypothetical protein EBZ17_09840, partial [Actinobacteria bacterium]|nr:hypothetical protein [Actinomycetota bacterium]
PWKRCEDAELSRVYPLRVAELSCAAEHPLVIMGPGAGPQITASGVLNDILETAREMKR